MREVPGDGAMWVEAGEQLVMEKTGEVFPGLVVTGLAVSAVYGTPRMGPAFGAMLLSGRKAAQLILQRGRRAAVAAGKGDRMRPKLTERERRKFAGRM